MQKYLYLLPMVMGMGLAAHAQQDPKFSHYIFNQVFLNPAAAGSDGLTRVQLVHRIQWQGYTSSFDGGDGNPSTQFLSVEVPIVGIRSGVALHLTNDQLGPQSNQEAVLSYAYRMPLGAGTLALGLRGGLYVRSFNFDRFRPIDPNDPLLGTGKINETHPDFGAGLHYSTAKFYVGASMLHLTTPAYTFIRSAEFTNRRSLYVQGGYRYQLNEAIELFPNAIYRTDLSSSSVEATLLATWRGQFWAGAGYRQGEGVPILLGANYRRFRIGAAFDMVTSGVAAKAPFSWEVLLSYAMPGPQPNRRLPIRTPRYRF